MGGLSLPTLHITTHRNNSSITFPEQDRPFENQDAWHIGDQTLESNDKFRISTRPGHRRPSAVEPSPAWAAGAVRGRAQGHGPARPAAPPRTPGPAAAQPGGDTQRPRQGLRHALRGHRPSGTLRPPARPAAASRQQRGAARQGLLPSDSSSSSSASLARTSSGSAMPSRLRSAITPRPPLCSRPRLGRFCTPDPHRAAAPGGQRSSSGTSSARPRRAASRPRARARARPRPGAVPSLLRCPPGAPWCARRRGRERGGGCGAGTRTRAEVGSSGVQ